MKTVLLIHASGAQYFRNIRGAWQTATQTEPGDRLWVIVNLPEETLEALNVPLLFGRDRNSYLARRLAATFPHSHYHAAAFLSGGLISPGIAVLTGLSSADAVSNRIEKQSIPVTGVWGMAMLLTLMLKKLHLNNLLLVLPDAHFVRILVIKQGTPVLTRCVRHDEEEGDNDAGEILRTRQHLENRHIFEHEQMPAVLYLGDASKISAPLAAAGLTVMPLPEALSPRGEAAYLHALFEHVTTSPAGQLAPLQLRVSHLAENVRRTAYTGIMACLLAAILFGQEDFRALLTLHRRGHTLNGELQQAMSERAQLTARISSSGLDPALVRQATTFAALEIDIAPTPEAILQLAASAIADLPQVRIKNLTYRFPKPGERYCQGHTVIDVPLINQKIELRIPPGSKPHDAGNNETSTIPNRYAELQFSILLTENPASEAEIRKRISTVLKATDGIQLMEDPAAFSLINTLKGGFGMDTTRSENLWCMSILWKSPSLKDLP
ncbi:MAG: hypothetical protein WC736_00925 [Gallionella sp.]|jgi:hypothetical protein